MSTASLGTLGYFGLQVEGRAVPSPRTKKARAILAYLIGRAGTDVSREKLLDTFWPGAGPVQARQSLKTALSSIRQCLRSGELDPDAVIVAEKSVVRWLPRSTLDYERFIALSIQDDENALREALLLYRGDFLEGDFDDWAVAERERIDTAYESVLDRIVRISGSAEAAQRLLARNPYNEGAYAALIEAELRAGRPLAATALVERCRGALKEVGAKPSAEFEAEFSGLQRPARPPMELRVPRFPLEGEQAAADGEATRETAVRCPAFIGRRNELDSLMEAWRAAGTGRGAIVLVEGDAGIGKTRLVQEFEQRVRADGKRFVRAHCLDYAPSPFGPLLDLIRALHVEDPEPIVRSPAILRSLAALMPELRNGESVKEEQDKRGQLDGIVAALKAHASRAPFTAVIEDAQWADIATCDALLHVANAVGKMGLALVVTARTGDHQTKERNVWLTTKLARSGGAARIALSRLSDGEMADFVEATLGQHARPPAGVVNEARGLAEGNPLFAEQLLRVAVDGARTGATQTALPASVSEIALDRLRAMEPDQRDLLAIAAAGRWNVDVDFLERVSEMPRGAVITAMRRAVDLQLLDPDPAQPDSFSFHHGLFRAAIYGQLLAAEQKDLHRRILRALEADEAGVDNIAELAYHSWHAGPLPSAAGYNEKAGDAAFQLNAFADAAQLYDRAIAACEGDLLRARLLVKLSGAQHYNGDIERARRTIEQAIDIYERAGDTIASAKTAIAAGRTLTEAGRFAESAEILQRGLTLLERHPNDPNLFATRVALANVHVFRNDPAAALAELERADAFAGERDERARIRFHLWRGHARAFTGDLRGADEDHARAVALAEQAGHGLSLVLLLGSYGIRMAYMGHRRQALEALARGLSAAKEHQVGGLPRGFCLLQCASASQQFGDLETARIHLRSYLALDMDHTRAQVYAALVGVPVALRLLDFDLAKRCARAELIEHAFEIGTPEFVGSVATAFAELYRDQGRHEEAAALLHRAVEALPEQSSPLDDEAVDYLFIQVAAFGYAHDFERARHLLSLRTGLEANRGPAACLALFDALVAARQKAGRAAQAPAKAAAAAFKELGWPQYEAMALELLGRPAEALDLYKLMGSLRDTNRLELALFSGR